jgi:23S rRNA (cytosine1962-C5)-methyltransferase
MQEVQIRKGREGAIQRRSPWLFSGSVQREEEGIADGDLVRVVDAAGRVLGYGDYQGGSIRVRMLYFGDGELPSDLVPDLLDRAWSLRRQLGLQDDPLTDCYRLVHAAGDSLPGLVVDRYGPVAVIQCHSIGMHRRIGAIADSLIERGGGVLTTVYDKSNAVLPERYAAIQQDGPLRGELPGELMVRENGRRFLIDVAGGQKTGFFLDQRENRWLLGSYAKGQRVLNLFSYSGGFSVYGLLGAAAEVHSVDQSEAAITLCERNVAANGELTGSHAAFAADALTFLKEGRDEQGYDIIVVDPPAYAKNKHRRHKAVQAYKRLNVAALSRLRPGGLLFTFSCSRVVDRQLFYDTIVAAGLEAGRPLRVLHRLGQGPDHPVSLYHPEGEYLKGLVLRAD